MMVFDERFGSIFGQIFRTAELEEEKKVLKSL